MQIPNAFLCGRFDGSSLWVQWDDVSPEGVHLQIRLRPDEASAWAGWIPIQEKAPKRKPWAVIPVNRGGWQVEARIAAVESPEEWGPLREVTFQKSTASFEFSLARGSAYYGAGREFSSYVDGAPCHYTLDEAIGLEAGETKIVSMTAHAASGWAQLDRADHFKNHLTGGLQIRNVGPSTNDLAETGRLFTVLEQSPIKTGFRIMFGRQIS